MRQLLIFFLLAIHISFCSGEVISIPNPNVGFFHSKEETQTIYRANENSKAVLIFLPGGVGSFGTEPNKKEIDRFYMLTSIAKGENSGDKFDFVFMDSPYVLSPKEMRKAVNDFAESKGYVFKASTHTITKIVKCVFGVDRRRTSTYSLVLRAALKRDILNKDLIGFIQAGGGVEEIRLGSTGKGLSTKQKAQVAATTVVVNNLGTASGQALVEMLDAGKIGDNKVFIGAWQADGTVVLRAAIESETVLNAALASHYAANEAQRKAKAKEEEAALLAEVKKKAADAAAATATLIA